jgi:hypothetical protein
MIKRLVAVLLEDIENAHRATYILSTDGTGQILTCNVILDDTEAEAKYDFSMRATLERISSNIEQGTSLLGGWWIYVCRGVAGSKAPSGDELKLIVEASGGTWLASLNDYYEGCRCVSSTGDHR